jgi:hypothetical protein
VSANCAPSLVSTIAGPNWVIASNRTWSGRSTNINTVPRTLPCSPRWSTLASARITRKGARIPRWSAIARSAFSCGILGHGAPGQPAVTAATTAITTTTIRPEVTARTYTHSVRAWLLRRQRADQEPHPR